MSGVFKNLAEYIHLDGNVVGTPVMNMTFDEQHAFFNIYTVNMMLCSMKRPGSDEYKESYELAKQAVETALAKGLGIDIVPTISPFKTLFMIAAQYNNTDMMGELYRMGANPLAEDFMGFTANFYAVMAYTLSLHKKDAALIYVTKKTTRKIMEYSMEYLKNNFPTSETEQTEQTCSAARNCNRPILEILETHGIDPTRADKHGSTALDYAVYRSRYHPEEYKSIVEFINGWINRYRGKK